VNFAEEEKIPYDHHSELVSHVFCNHSSFKQ